MQTIMYAGLRNAARDQAIAEALMFKHAKEVAREFNLAPSTVRTAAKRITETTVFDLKLIGGGSPMSLGLVGASSFRKAALGVYRAYHGTFRNLDLPCWKITDGENTIDVMDVRNIDTGAEAV